MKNSEKYAWIIPIVVVLIGCISCDLESEVEIDDIHTPSRLVMNSIFFVENDTNTLYFSSSKSIFSPENSRKALKYESEYWSYWYADPKVYYLPDVQTVLYKNGIQQRDVYANPDDSITYYIDNQINAGDKFLIEANQDGRKISASTTIPVKPQILGVDTMSFIENNSSNGYGHSNSSSGYLYTPTNLRLFIRIKEQPDTKDFYRIFVDTEVKIQIDPEYAKYRNIPETGTLKNSFMNSDDLAITNGNPKNNNNSDFATTEFQQNYYNIFTDDLFKNGEYTLNVFIPYPENSSYYYSFGYVDPKYIISKKVNVTIRLQALSPELYQYYNSLQKFLYNNEDVIEPFRVFNNIEGGIGILGSINQLRYVVYEEEKTH